MTIHWPYILIAAMMVLLFPLVPEMLKLRISTHRALRLTWFADVTERHFSAFVLSTRIVLGAIFLFSLLVGFGLLDIV